MLISERNSLSGSCLKAACSETHCIRVFLIDLAACLSCTQSSSLWVEMCLRRVGELNSVQRYDSLVLSMMFLYYQNNKAEFVNNTRLHGLSSSTSTTRQNLLTIHDWSIKQPIHFPTAALHRFEQDISIGRDFQSPGTTGAVRLTGIWRVIQRWPDSTIS